MVSSSSASIPNAVNSPILTYGACFLWLVSIVAILWSLIIFINLSDILCLIGTDMINAVVLLSGITMMPTYMQMIYYIGRYTTITASTKVVCCPIWLCMVWSLAINIVGLFLVLQRIASIHKLTENFLATSMQLYRTNPKYKRSIDNLQWFFGCCGLNSYKDWFSQDWYDKVRDYEWDPAEHKHSPRHTAHIDSVPLSCCKSGSCISNYLSELGTYSINTNGCSNVLCRIIQTSLTIHAVLFSVVIIVQVSMLIAIMRTNKEQSLTRSSKSDTVNVRHIMSPNVNFESSNTSETPDSPY